MHIIFTNTKSLYTHTIGSVCFDFWRRVGGIVENMDLF